jgi:hypothetical protein
MRPPASTPFTPLQPVPPAIASIRSVSSDFAPQTQCRDLHHPHHWVSDSPQMSVIPPQNKRHLYDNQGLHAILNCNANFAVMSDILPPATLNPPKWMISSVDRRNAIHWPRTPALSRPFPRSTPRFSLPPGLPDVPLRPLRTHPQNECRSTKSGPPMPRCLPLPPPLVTSPDPGRPLVCTLIDGLRCFIPKRSGSF